jgi:hypothetical protein
METDASNNRTEEERRQARRYDVSLPIVMNVHAGAETVQRNGQTRDISTRGLYFVTQDEIAPGTEFELSLTLPAGDVFIRARGRVIRIERGKGTNGPAIGVAATMESYDIVRADAAAR